MTTISVTSKYVGMLELGLKYPLLLDIYVFWTYDYNIRDF